MISSLAGYPEGQDDTKSNDGDGLFDRPDQVLDEPLEIPDVPQEVEDEQEQVFEEANKEAEAPKDEEEPEDDSKEYWKRAAEGRLQEALRTREKLAETQKSVEQLRRIWLKQEQERAEARKAQERQELLRQEAQLYGEDVVNDPAARYLRDKMQQTQEMIERQRQQEEAQRRIVQEQQAEYARQQQAQAEALSRLERMEAEMQEKHPDYLEAYNFAVNKRAKMYEARGYSREEAEMQVRNEEAFLFAEQMQRGGNPAEVAYKMAKEWGWQTPQEKAPRQKADMSRMKSSIESGSGSGRLKGSPGRSGDAQYMTNEEFFSTVPDHIRLKVLGDQDKFEELGRTGRIKVDW
jgi:hypothetical protein